MMASVLARNTGLVTRTRAATGLRALSVHPRSKNTPDLDADDDNILPVRADKCSAEVEGVASGVVWDV